MIPRSHTVAPDTTPLVAVIGPTASGKSARAIELAQQLHGEVISVDSRQVYQMLDIGTEKLSSEEMQGIPHHLISIRDPKESYSAGDFVQDATRLIREIRARGNTPILAGGTHFYFEALLYGLPAVGADEALRAQLETLSTPMLYAQIQTKDPARAEKIDPQNRRRLVRALEILESTGTIPARATVPAYEMQWHLIDQDREILRARLGERLERALARGLIEEVRAVRDYVGDARLNELGLEYRIVGEYLRGERLESELLPVLAAKLWQYAHHQKMWLRKLA